MSYKTRFCITGHNLEIGFLLKCDPPSSKSCCLIYKIRGLPLTLMIHFVNVQTSKLEQHMQVHVYHMYRKTSIMGISYFCCAVIDRQQNILYYRSFWLKRKMEVRYVLLKCNQVLVCLYDEMNWKYFFFIFLCT